MKGHGTHIAQSEISGKVMRSAAYVGIVRYTIITSDRSSIAKDSLACALYIRNGFIPFFQWLTHPTHGRLGP